MSGRTYTICMAVLTISVLAIPAEYVEAIKLYIVSIVTFISTIVTVLFNMPKLMDVVGRHFAREFAREYWIHKKVDERLKAEQDLIEREMDAAREKGERHG